MTCTELPRPSLELQTQFINCLKYAVCDQIGKHQVREKNKIYRRQRKRKRSLQDQGPSYSSYSPRDREGLKRLRLCSEIMPVQSPHTGSWSLETRNTIPNDTPTSSNSEFNHQQPHFRIHRRRQSHLPPGLSAMQPISILRPTRPSHTEELDDNSSDWSDCTSSESDSGCYSGSSSPPLLPSFPSLRPRKSVRFDAASLLANHATFRALGYSDTLYATLGRRRRREVIGRVLKRILQAFWMDWEERQRRKEEARRAMPVLLGGPQALRALDESLARQAVVWEERFRDWDRRGGDGEGEERSGREGKNDSGGGGGGGGGGGNERDA